jgi:hypothetical protein
MLKMFSQHKKLRHIKPMQKLLSLLKKPRITPETSLHLPRLKLAIRSKLLGRQPKLKNMLLKKKVLSRKLKLLIRRQIIRHNKLPIRPAPNLKILN